MDASKEVESEDEENLMGATEDDYEEAAAMIYTVTFKCIDATKTPKSQAALKTTGELLASGNHVPVDLFPQAAESL